MVSGPSSESEVGWFSIPSPAVARHPGVMLTPKELKRWLETLPMANPSKSAGLLLQQLRLLVRDPDPGNRLPAMLDLYEQPARDLLDIVCERLHKNSDAALPLDQLEHLMLETLTELAYGQLRQANKLLAVGKKPGLDILFGALALIDQALAIEHQHYHQVSAETWRLVLGILQHAEKSGCSKEPFAGSPRDPDQPKTIHALAMRALLVGLCDPCHFRPKEVLQWRQWCGIHGEKLQMTLLPQGNATVPIDAEGDLSPLTAARRGKPGPHMRYLATDALMDELNGDPNAPSGLQQALENLIKGRRSPEQRKAARHQRQQNYRLFNGVRNMHQRLSELIQGPNDGQSAGQAIECQQFNQSRRGSAFLLNRMPGSPMAIGEPVLLEAIPDKPGGAATGFTAQIQRVVIDESDRIEIGVEKFDGRLAPVAFEGAAKERSQGANHALLQHQTESGSFTLIAPLSIYKEGEVITVEGPGIHYRLRLQQLLGVTRTTAYINTAVA